METALKSSALLAEDKFLETRLQGHQHVLDYFRKGLELDRLATTYLFSGSAGIGKRVAARALACFLHCENPKSNEACGQCTHCQSIQTLASPYYYEKYFEEEKKNTGLSTVDIVRRFIEEVQTLSSVQRKIIFCLPNIQGYSIQVQNALLKILEEPPINIIFILTSDQPERVLETIQSRSQIINFQLLSHDDLKNIFRLKSLQPDNMDFLLEISDGCAEKAIKYTLPNISSALSWIKSLFEKFDHDFLDVAEKALELSENFEFLENDESQELEGSKQDRRKLHFFIDMFEKVYYNHLLHHCRHHFVAMQVLNTTVEDLLKAKHSIQFSGHLALSTEHYFQMAFSRLAQISRYAKVKETDPLMANMN